MKGFQRLATINFVLLVALSLLAAHSSAPSGNQDERPGVYPDWGQFTVCQSQTPEPRIVTIERHGAGPHRRAEYFVYEVVEGGKRLRQLYQHGLKSDFAMWGKFCLGMGRFLVTMNDRFGADPKNSLVVYDFARKTSTSWSLQEFLTEAEILKLEADLVYPGPHWWSGFPAFDRDRQLFFPNRAEECRENGYPCVTVDLLSQSVKLSSPPPSMASEAESVGQTSRGVTWDWSLDTSSEPSWSAPFCLPALLLAEVRDLPRLTVVGLDEPRICYRLHSESRDYHRCSLSEWVDKKIERKK